MGKDRSFRHGYQLAPDISQGDFDKLEEHLGSCRTCRAAFSDFAALLREGSSSGKVQCERPSWFRHVWGSPNPYRKRFVSRARHLGIPISKQAGRSDLPLTGYVATFRFALVCLGVVVIIAILGYQVNDSNREIARLKQQNNMLARNAGMLWQRIEGLTEANKALEHSILEASTGYRSVLDRNNKLEKGLRSASVEIDSLKKALELTQIRKSELQQRLQITESRLAQVTNRLHDALTDKTKYASMVEARESKLSELSSIIDYQVSQLNHLEALLEADQDIRGLMGARNLHVIDVFDVDRNGNNRAPFGRVFYTEGRSLVFYAFDLKKKGASEANYSFQAWGYREPFTGSARNLGIFYVDDAKNKRWVLRFNDPSVLREIDAVFVTIEWPGGAEKPTGDRLLYAYLKNKPNHP